MEQEVRHWPRLRNADRLQLDLSAGDCVRSVRALPVTGFPGAADRLLAVELVPVIAHPERSIGLQADFAIARALVERGCLLCPNGDSALGDNGPVAEQVFWRLVDEGLVTLVASDGHRRHRPPRLDQAHRLLVERYGQASIEMLFDGSAIPWIQ